MNPSRRKPLTDEMLRILRAVERGDLYVNRHGRYNIVGQLRPDRKSRERLLGRGYIVNTWKLHFHDSQESIKEPYRLTDLGRKALGA